MQVESPFNHKETEAVGGLPGAVQGAGDLSVPTDLDQGPSKEPGQKAGVSSGRPLGMSRTHPPTRKDRPVPA